MTKQLLDGPGRTLECIHPKFMVDLVQGADAQRHTSVGSQQQHFRERLTQEIMAQAQLRQWAMGGMFSENAVLRLGLAEKLAGMVDPGHLALTRAFTLADASAMMPLDYTKLPFAALLGYLAFGETMDLWAWVGAGIIAGSTIYIAQREAMLARRAKSAATASAAVGNPAE